MATLFLVALFFVGCAKKDESPKIELEVIPSETDTALTEENKSFAKDTLYRLLCTYQEKRAGTLKADAKIKAERQANFIIENGEFALSQKDYVSSFEIIEKRNDEIAEGLRLISGGDFKGGAAILEEAYRELKIKLQSFS